MKKNKSLLYTIENIPDKYIDEAFSEKARKMKIQWKYIITAVACFAIVASVPIYLLLNESVGNKSDEDGMATNVSTEVSVTDQTEITTNDTKQVTEKVEDIPQSNVFGTGPEKSLGYVPDRDTNTCGGFDVIDGYFTVLFLKDKEYQQQINDEIKVATDSLKPYFDEKYLGDGTHAGDANPWEILENTNGVTVLVSCENGYLSVALGYSTEMNDEIGIYGGRSFEHVAVLNYDLIEKKKIENFSDLFYKGEDFMSYINKSVLSSIAFLSEHSYLHQKKEFKGFMEEPNLFTINGIIFDADNPYFEESPSINLLNGDDSIYDIMLCGKYRDMTEIVDDAYLQDNCHYQQLEWRMSDSYTEKKNDITIHYTKWTSRFHTEDEIAKKNEFYNEIYNTVFEYNYENGMYDGLKDVYTGNYSVYPCSYLNNVYNVSDNNSDDAFSLKIDSETFKIIYLENYIEGKWQDYIFQDNRKDKNGKIEENKWCLWAVYEPGYDVVYLANGDEISDGEGDGIILEIPIDKIKDKYRKKSDSEK